MDLRELLVVVIILLLSWFLATSEACASELTDEADFWYYTSQGMIVADWLTTRNAAERHDEGYYEANPIVAPIINNSDGTINKTRLDVLSVLVLIGNHQLQSHMNSRQRRDFNMYHSLIRFVVVSNNMHIGLRIRF